MSEQYNGEQVIQETDSNLENARVCPKCKSTLTNEQKFCPSCGTKTEELLSQEKVCANCGAKMQSETKFCSACGKEAESVDTKILRECPKCKTVLTDEQKFCPVCGAEAQEKKEPQIQKCASCGTVIPPETAFCPNCGKKANLSQAEKKKYNKKLSLITGVVIVAIIAAASVAIWFMCREIPVENIELSESVIELKKEETKNISCTVYPEKATDKSVIWTSSDETVATVNSYGMITAVGKGTCTITAQSGDQTKTVAVTVKIGIDFEKLYDDYCSSIWATLGNDNSYLSIDSNPFDYDDGDYRYRDDAYDAVEKINRTLGLPEYLYDEIVETYALMGKQKEEFKDIGVSVSWTYHPDKGLEITYKIIEE